MSNIQSDNQDDGQTQTSLDFHFHYNEAPTLGGILTQILSELASFTQVHNWEDDSGRGHMQQLATIASSYLKNVGSGEANELIDCSVVEDVSIQGGIASRQPLGSDLSVAANYIFPSKPAGFDQPDPPGQVLDSSVDLSRGRITHIDAGASLAQRPTLLLLHAFGLRLQNEDPAFIREFIQRHASLQYCIKAPTQFQSMSPSNTDGGDRICYRRLSYSCHMPHLLLQEIDPDKSNRTSPDLKVLEPFSPEVLPAKNSLNLCRASSSVLLTLTVPEKSISRHEETDLIKSRRCLWSVLVVNSRRERFHNNDIPPAATLTPIAQLLRGICDILRTQRINEQHILDTLKSRLDAADDMSLFDDEKFTKSHLYHWAVRTSDAVCHSISTCLRFVDRLDRSLTKELVSEVYETEKSGIELWKKKTVDETNSLKELQEELLSLRQGVQERRNALHSATSILEARSAFQQGERVKILTYLAIIYLPLGTAAGIYSINPLPESATLWSFFVLLSGLILTTVLIYLGLNHISNKLSIAARNAPAQVGGVKAFFRLFLPNALFQQRHGRILALVEELCPSALWNYFQYMADVWTPPSDLLYESGVDKTMDPLEKHCPPAIEYWNADSYFTLSFYLVFIYRLCFSILHHVAIPWLAWPRTLLTRFRYRRIRGGAHWSLFRFFRDIILILLSPIAFVLFVTLTVPLIALDIAAAAVHLLRGTVSCQWILPE